MTKFTVSNGNYDANVCVRWIPDNQYNVAHYNAFITVPFQDSNNVHLYVFNKSELDVAIDKATEYAKMFLSRCTLC